MRTWCTAAETSTPPGGSPHGSPPGSSVTATPPPATASCGRARPSGSSTSTRHSWAHASRASPAPSTGSRPCKGRTTPRASASRRSSPPRRRLLPGVRPGRRRRGRRRRPRTAAGPARLPARPGRPRRRGVPATPGGRPRRGVRGRHPPCTGPPRHPAECLRGVTAATDGAVRAAGPRRGAARHAWPGPAGSGEVVVAAASAAPATRCRGGPASEVPVVGVTGAGNTARASPQVRSSS